MKIYKYILAFFVTTTALSCVVEPENFGVNLGEGQKEVTIGPEGGVTSFKVTSSESWVAKTTAPWLTVSPANGVGTADCKIIIDSTLIYNDTRETIIRIETVSGAERMDFKLIQEGFPYTLTLDKTEVEVAAYKTLAERKFQIELTTNFEYNVVIPESAINWLSASKPEINLDRGARPRKSVLTFEWKANYMPEDRNVEVAFVPKNSEIQPTVLQTLVLNQDAAEKIEAGTVAGDSLAIIAIKQSIGSWRAFDPSEKLEHWLGISIWLDGPNKGRVRKASFELFDTKESIPYQVQYLTAAEELVFYGNGNSFLLDLDTGEYLSKLVNLKRLTIGAYGLVDLHPSMVAMKKLEYLNLVGNNFQDLPAILTKENFPNLRTLMLHANQRKAVFDLSQSNWPNIGGFLDACPIIETHQLPDGKIRTKREFPVELLKWDTLDTLRLSVNHLQGEIPDLMDDPSFPKWTEDEIDDCDTLTTKLIGLPKVLPNTNFFAINLNKLTGTLPDWLLYHPKLDQWFPLSLVFEQYGNDENGTPAGFTNTPPNLNYYYELDGYENKKYKEAFVTE